MDTSHWRGPYYPRQVDAKHYYIYLQTLESGLGDYSDDPEAGKNPGLAAMARQAFSIKETGTVESKTMTAFYDAIATIRNAAATEQQKERALIKSHADKLGAKAPIEQPGETYKYIIEGIEAINRYNNKIGYKSTVDSNITKSGRVVKDDANQLKGQQFGLMLMGRLQWIISGKGGPTAIDKMAIKKATTMAKDIGKASGDLDWSTPIRVAVITTMIQAFGLVEKEIPELYEGLTDPKGLSQVVESMANTLAASGLFTKYGTAKDIAMIDTMNARIKEIKRDQKKNKYDIRKARGKGKDGISLSGLGGEISGLFEATANGIQGLLTGRYGTKIDLTTFTSAIEVDVTKWLKPFEDVYARSAGFQGELGSIAYEMQSLQQEMAKEYEKLGQTLFIQHGNIKSYQSKITADGSFGALVSGNGFKAGNEDISLASLQSSSLVQGLYKEGLLDDEAMEYMIFGINNLSQYAMNNTNRDVYESYLSVLIAGFLFDDFLDIYSHGVVANAKEQSVQAIHLMILNDRYIPLSFLLNGLADNLQAIADSNFIQKLDRGVVNTRILPNDLSYAQVQTYPKKGRKANWDRLAREGLESTKINIRFMGAFNKIIAALGV